MIRVNQEERVAAKSTDTPYNASGLEFHEGPVPFVSESCSTYLDDGTDRAVRLFLSECCSETIGAGVAMQMEWSRLVNNSVPIGEDKYRWSCEFRE